MNGAPGLPDNARGEANAEDLDSVLGRFQEWTKSRRDQPSSRYGSAGGKGRGAPSKVNLAVGARELSYEQALRASSYRRLVYSETTALKPHEAVSSAEPEPKSGDPRANIADPRKTAQAVVSNGTPAADFRPAKRSPSKTPPGTGARPPVVGPTAASVPLAGVPGPAPPIVIEDGQPLAAPGVKKRSRRSGGKSAARSAERRRTGHSTSQPPIAVSSVISKPMPPQTSIPPRKFPGPHPAFRQVFEESAELVSAAKVESKSIALSLRVSEAEHTRIQACAARENLSVSAYLRQCALGVDILRDQVHLALGELQKQDAKPAPPPGLAAIPGILGRSATRWFRRLRGRNDYTGISLR